MVQANQKNSRTKRTLPKVLATLVVLLLSGASLSSAHSAIAATESELLVWWATGTPASSNPGSAVTAEVRINVNDDRPAPSNDPVDDFTATFNTTNGKFTSLPALCLVDGVTPPSSISADGSEMICNFGTQVEGTALSLQIPMQTDGTTGDQLTFDAQVGEGPVSAQLTHDIVSEFLMDISLEGSSGVQARTGNTRVMQFEWTVNWGKDSEVGPSSVQYVLTVDNAPGTLDSVYACGAFTDQVASAHPNSGAGSAPERTAPTATCTLARIGATNQWVMTLSGLDYTMAQVPTESSNGRALPTDRVAIASGKFTVNITAANAGSVSVTAHTPTYTSIGGQTVVDDPANNVTTKTWLNRGLWVSSWHRGLGDSGGSPFDDTYRVAPGATVYSQTYFDQALQTRGLADSDNIALCTIIDTKYATYDTVGVTTAPGGAVPAGAVYRWYVGSTQAQMNPNSPSYSPGSISNCGLLTGGQWVTTEPTDKNTIQAVFAVMPYGSVKTQTVIQMIVKQTIKATAPVGMDVWQFSSYFVQPNGWLPADSNPGVITPIPNARYPHTNGYRDVLRVVGVTPWVNKTVDSTAVTLGSPVTFTLEYAANGLAALPTIDGYTVVDRLPKELTYVAGSASPEPTITLDGDSQVLTWSLDNVPTNEIHSLTYEAMANEHAQPGQRIVNSASSTVQGRDSGTSEIAVTISSNGRTIIGKSADQAVIPNVNGDGVGEGSWTVSLRSEDPIVQSFTDVIDILPYNGDSRGTSFSGTYSLKDVVISDGETVYYTTHDPTALTDDSADTTNGSAGDISGNSVGWTQTKPADESAITGVRVIGGTLAAATVRSFQVVIETDSAEAGDLFVNRAQARASHTILPMRTSAPTEVGHYYSFDLKKYVLGADSVWHDAQDENEADWPIMREGDDARYKFVLTNTGTGDLESIVVTDPLLGVNWEVASLASGEELESAEYGYTIPAGTSSPLRNEACAAAPLPDGATQPELTQPCDEANITVDGDPTHTKTILSATPIGNGQWEIFYELEVTNAAASPTSYSLDDELRYSNQIVVVSAEVTSTPAGVTVSAPPWDGQSHVGIAEGVELLGNSDTGYEPHVYTLRVIADVPLNFGPTLGGFPASQCDAPGEETESAFNNTSQLTKSDGEVEDDQACASPPSLHIEKEISSGPTSNGNGTWTVIYDIVATNDGHADGEYDLSDTMTPEGAISVISSAIIAAPAGVTTSPTWTGQGAVGAAENVIATGVTLPVGGVHTYQAEVIIELTEAGVGDPIAGECTAGGNQLSNTAEIEHNDLTEDDAACVTVDGVQVEFSLPALGGNGPMTYIGIGVLILLIALASSKVKRGSRRTH